MPPAHHPPPQATPRLPVPLRYRRSPNRAVALPRCSQEKAAAKAKKKKKKKPKVKAEL